MNRRARHSKASKVSAVRSLVRVAGHSTGLARKARFLGLAWKTMGGAKRTDEVIRSKPYQSIGVAFGLGLLLGCMIKNRES